MTTSELSQLETPIEESILSGMSHLAQMGPSTRSVHAGRLPNPYHAISEPIVQAATYTFDNTQDLLDFKNLSLWEDTTERIEYGRYGNPTVFAAEARLAALEKTDQAIIFASGMAAITTTLLGLLFTGDHLVITDDMYRKTRQFCEVYLARLGIDCTVVPIGDYAILEGAIRPQTRLIFSESPTNPYLRVVDLERLAEIAGRHGIKTVVDTTFATPLNVRPVEWGIDLVIHSGTKYLAGHKDIMSGAVAGGESLVASLREFAGVIGAISDPHNASLLLRGLKTLGLRLERQNDSGQRVAEFLENHPAVEDVWYPGLPSHPDYTVAKRQLQGFGGVVSFTVKGGLEAASRFIDALRIPQIATSLGGTESLVSQPTLMAYYELSRQERLALGIRDNLVRLALGVEDCADLIADLDQALCRA